MASPKSKISRSHRGSRRAHKSLKLTATWTCTNCKAPHKPHHVCLSCGYYNKREVMRA